MGKWKGKGPWHGTYKSEVSISHRKNLLFILEKKGLDPDLFNSVKVVCDEVGRLNKILNDNELTINRLARELMELKRATD